MFSSSSSNAQQVTVLILGGCETGLASAFLPYLWDLSVKPEKRRASHIRLVDRLLFLPQQKVYLRGWLHPDARKVLEDGHSKGVEYQQANLLNAEARAKVFVPPESTGKKAYDVVFDLSPAAVTQGDEKVLIEWNATLSRLNGMEALKNGGVGAYIRLTTPFLTMPAKNGRLRESDADTQVTVAWAKWAHEGDRALAALPDLNLVLARIANPWGAGSLLGLTRRLVVASVYQYLGKSETMELLWGKDLVLEHIHISDMASAFYALAMWQLNTAKTRAHADELAKAPLPPVRPSAVPSKEEWKSEPSVYDECEIEGLPKRTDTLYAPLFHVSDASGQTQEEIGKIMEKAFNIKVDYLPAITNALAKMNMSDVFEIAEEKHGDSWLEMLSCSNPPISNTPFSPSLPMHILRKNRCHLDTSRIQQMTGWKPKYQKVTADEVKKMVKLWKEEGIWPNAPPKKA